MACAPIGSNTVSRIKQNKGSKFFQLAMIALIGLTPLVSELSNQTPFYKQRQNTFNMAVQVEHLSLWNPK